MASNSPDEPPLVSTPINSAASRWITVAWPDANLDGNQGVRKCSSAVVGGRRPENLRSSRTLADTGELWTTNLKTDEAATLPGVRIPLPPPTGLGPIRWTTFYDKEARWMGVECSLSNSFGVR